MGTSVNLEEKSQTDTNTLNDTNKTDRKRAIKVQVSPNLAATDGTLEDDMSLEVQGFKDQVFNKT